MRRKLTPSTLQALRPGKGRVEVWDTLMPGFFARISSQGVTFGIRYRVGRRQRRHRIGTAPPLSLAEARKQARGLLSRAQLGHDPQLERHARRHGEDLAGVCQAFVDAGIRRGLAASTVGEYRRIIRAYIVGATVARVPVAELRRRDAREWLEKVAGQHGGAQANRVFQLARAACRWAVRDELLASNPLDGLRRPSTEAPRERVLSDDEVEILWTVLAGEDGCAEPDWPPASSAAVQVLLLLGQRSGETLEMRWEEVDLDARPGLWTIPGRHRKGGRLQVVPLPPLVVRILTALLPAGQPEPARGRAFAGVSAGNAERDWWGKIRRKMMVAGAEHFHRHDLRRTCATGCARLGAAPEVVSRILGHSVHPGGALVTGTYDRYDRLAEKAAALVAWAAHVEGLVAGRVRGAVVPFGR